MICAEPQRPAERELRDFLTSFRALRDDHVLPPEYVYSCPEAFLLDHGTFFTPTGLPGTVQPMPLQQSFENAFRVARRTQAYHYVEGYANNNIMPVFHAWLIDQEGNAFDPTWATNPPNTLGSSYFGVELDLAEVRLSRRAGVATLLYDYRRDYPALQGVDVLAKDAWFRR